MTILLAIGCNVSYETNKANLVINYEEDTRDYKLETQLVSRHINLKKRAKTFLIFCKLNSLLPIYFSAHYE